jgi:hypothetical protein
VQLDLTMNLAVGGLSTVKNSPAIPNLSPHSKKLVE